MYKSTTTLFGKSCTNCLISHRFVVAYKKPIAEAFFYLSIYIRLWHSEEIECGRIYMLVAVRGLRPSMALYVAYHEQAHKVRKV